MPAYRDPNDTPDLREALRPAGAAKNDGRRFDLVEWTAVALFTVTGALFALCLIACGWGIGQVPDANAIQNAPANVLAANVTSLNR